MNTVPYFHTKTWYKQYTHISRQVQYKNMIFKVNEDKCIILSDKISVLIFRQDERVLYCQERWVYYAVRQDQCIILSGILMITVRDKALSMNINYSQWIDDTNSSSLLVILLLLLSTIPLYSFYLLVLKTLLLNSIFIFIPFISI